jgi:hypothetical protein
MDGNPRFGEGTNPEISICVNAGECRIWSEGNCRISFCNNEDLQVCDAGSSWGGRARAIEDACADNTGGYQSPAPPADWTEVAIRLNSDWRLMSASAGPTYREITVEENRAELRALEAEIGSFSAVSKANGLKNRVCSRSITSFLQELTTYDAASGQILRRRHVVQHLHAWIRGVCRPSPQQRRLHSLRGEIGDLFHHGKRQYRCKCMGCSQCRDWSFRRLLHNHDQHHVRYHQHRLPRRNRSGVLATLLRFLRRYS